MTRHLALIRRGLAAAVLALGLAASGRALAQPADASAAELLAQVKAATGGARWDEVQALSAVGEKTSFGLTGPYRSAEDLATGRFARGADYGLFRNAEGLDEGGRWRMDNSGVAHPLDSDEARTVAVTDGYLAGRGYLFPERARATLQRIDSITEDGRLFDRVLATPEGGRAVMLWIGRADHRLARASMQLGSHPETLRYGDYRPAGGLVLPFDIATDNGDQLETGEAHIARYSLEAAAPAELRRPGPGAPDAGLGNGRDVAYAPLRMDAMSGFPLVEARINGQGPFLFILDTGGHDILTPAAAKTLGLALRGAGFSLGAGQGSTPTRYTKVAKVTLGEAEMRDQPFVVLQLDLGQAAAPGGGMAPISGIIGLELFERFTVTLDYAAGRLELRLPALEARASGAPIRFTSDMPLALASVDGRSGWFGLDTGNNTDVILFKAWVEAKGLPAWFEVSVDTSGAGVGGALSFRKGRAGVLALAGREVAGLPVLLAGDNLGGLSSKAEAGNIGESVFSRFRVTFDYAHERVSLDPPREAVAAGG
jgi:hypothetical protein